MGLFDFLTDANPIPAYSKGSAGASLTAAAAELSDEQKAAIQKLVDTLEERTKVVTAICKCPVSTGASQTVDATALTFSVPDGYLGGSVFFSFQPTELDASGSAGDELAARIHSIKSLKLLDKNSVDITPANWTTAQAMPVAAVKVEATFTWMKEAVSGTVTVATATIDLWEAVVANHIRSVVSATFRPAASA